MHLFLDEILMKFINWLQKKNKPLKKIQLSCVFR